MTHDTPTPDQFKAFEPLPTATPRQVLTEFPQFAYAFLRIRTKEKQLVRFRLNAAQMAYEARRSKRNLILKARQLGFSTLVQGHMYHEATTMRGFAGLTLSHNDEATQRLRRIFGRFYDAMADPRPAIGRNSDTITTFPGMDSEVTISTAGGGRAGRGGTMTRIHASEVAFWTDPEGILSGAMQGGDPVLDLESTPNGAQGFFYERCMRALDGDKDWALHFFPWWWDPTYSEPIDQDDNRDTEPLNEDEQELARKHGLTVEQINWRRHKKRELGHLFIQEYPEDPMTCFLTSGGSLFGNIAHAFDAARDAEPDPATRATRRYIGGLDWGQAEDYTVLHVGDLFTMQQVDLLRVNKMPWRDQRALIRKTCQKWGIWELYVEANSIGGPNLEELEVEFQEYGVRTQLRSFYTTAANKGPLLVNLASALQEGVYHLQNIPEQRQEFNTFRSAQTAANSWTYGAPKGGHDDTIIAAMAAWGGITGSLDQGLHLERGPDILSEHRG